MAFYIYYVKDGGTATANGGRYVDSSKKTGSWATAFSAASEYYDNILDAISASGGTAPTSGDVIAVSDAHSRSITSTETPLVPQGVEVVVVDDANVDTPSPATSPQITCSSDAAFRIKSASSSISSIRVSGLNAAHDGEWHVTSAYSNTLYNDCVFDFNVWDKAVITQTGQKVLMFNTDMTDISHFDVRDGHLGCLGGFISSYPNTAHLSLSNGNAYSNHVLFHGADLSSASDVLMTIGQTNIRPLYARFQSCKLPAAWSISRNATDTSSSTVVVSECDSAYQFYSSQHAGEIDFVTDVYYDAHSTLDDGSTKGSFEFDSNGDITKLDPLMYWPNDSLDVRALAAINTEAATKKKVRLRFVTASGETLEAEDLQIWVAYPKSAIPHQLEWVGHIPSRLETGTSLPTETGNWTGSGLGTQYYYDVDMGTPGNGRVLVIPGITKANVTVYFSWQLEFVA